MQNSDVKRSRRIISHLPGDSKGRKQTSNGESSTPCCSRCGHKFQEQEETMRINEETPHQNITFLMKKTTDNSGVPMAKNKNKRDGLRAPKGNSSSYKFNRNESYHSHYEKLSSNIIEESTFDSDLLNLRKKYASTPTEFSIMQNFESSSTMRNSTNWITKKFLESSSEQEISELRYSLLSRSICFFEESSILEKPLTDLDKTTDTLDFSRSEGVMSAKKRKEMNNRKTKQFHNMGKNESRVSLGKTFVITDHKTRTIFKEFEEETIDSERSQQLNPSEMQISFWKDRRTTSKVKKINSNKNINAPNHRSNLTTSSYKDFSDETDTEDMISDSVLDEDDRNCHDNPDTKEHDIIATKYGLPYDLINCSCSLKKTCKDLTEDTNSDCSTHTCYNFQKRYGQIEQLALRSWCDVKILSAFKIASKMFELLTSKPDKEFEPIFLQADVEMKTTYPHYWVHLFGKLSLNISSSLIDKENIEKVKVIKSCELVLKEQKIFSRHYRIKMENYGDDLNLTDERNTIDENFKKASVFLMDEYPTLFTYLIRKNFKIFIEERLLVDKDRRKFVKLSRKPKNDLLRHEMKYNRMINFPSNDLCCQQ